MDKNKTFAQIEQEYDQMEQTIKRMTVKPPMGYMRVPCGMMGTLCGSYLAPKRLQDTSWEEISKIAQLGLAPFYFMLGETKTITLKNGSTIELRIIGFDHDEGVDGRKLPISFETVQTLNEDFCMNDDWTNVGGWAESKLRRVLNTDIYALLPDDLTAVIKTCVKMTSKGGKGQDGTMAQTSDPLFILSEQEIFGRKIYSIGGEGHWYEWYRRENTPYDKKKQSGEPDWRWERSPYGSNTGYFCRVNSNGNAYHNAARYTYGVSFGFCV